MWVAGDAHGGMWYWCPDPPDPGIAIPGEEGKNAHPKTKCYKYTKEVAETMYGQIWVEILVGMILLRKHPTSMI